MVKNSFINGTIFLSAAFFITKILGFIFVVPFVAMVGENNYILYEYAYKPYAIMIMIATLGIPGAISKYVSKYQEKEKYENIRFVLINGSFIMLILGVVSFLALYASSDFIANFLVGKSFDNSGNSVNDVSYVIKIVSFALIIVPLLSMLRGFIQGYKRMEPSSLSQVIEQMVRVTVILIGTYVMIVVLNKDPVKAIGLSTFASFIGAFFGLVVMIIFMFKWDFKLKSAKGKQVHKKSIYKEIGVYILPFIFVGISVTLFQTIDTFSINGIMINKGVPLEEAELTNALVSLVQKVIVLPVAIASALSASLITFITSAYFGNRFDEIRNNITKSLKMIFFLVLPASFGFIILSKPIFSTIFGVDNALVGGDILSWYGLAPIFYSMYSVTAAILQGMDKIKMIVVSLVVGITLKLITNAPMIFLFDGVGTAYSTYIGFGASIIIQMYVIKKEGKYNWTENFIYLKEIVELSVIMSILVLPLGMISININSLLIQVMITISGITLGASFYLYMSYKKNIIYDIFGKFQKLQ